MTPSHSPYRPMLDPDTPSQFATPPSAGFGVDYGHVPEPRLEPMEVAFHDPMASGPGPAADPAWSPFLQQERGDMVLLASFAHGITVASCHLFAAFTQAGVRDIVLPPPHDTVPAATGIGRWYAALVNDTFDRYRDLRSALVHPWTPPPEVEPLATRAFFILSDLTPTGGLLRALLAVDRPRACLELALGLDKVADQIEGGLRLIPELSVARPEDPPSEEEARLDAVQADILQKAGEALSLTAAADRLGVSRQAVHKRIRGGTVLGLMRGSELVIPAAQIVERDSKRKIVDGLGDVVAVFDEAGAGRWSALQYLVEIDPAFAERPIDVLARGDKEAVVAAARAYLGLDEG